MTTVLCWGCGLLVVLVSCSGQFIESVMQPPVIHSPINENETFVNYRRPEDVTLWCNATGQPPPTYVWYRGDVKLPGLNSNIVVDDKTGLLTVKPPAQSEGSDDAVRNMEGNYSCRAITDFGNYNKAVAVSDSVKITVTRIEKWPNVQISSETAIQGHYASIPCINAPVAFGKAEFLWKKHMTENSPSEEIVPDERRYVDHNGTLHFIYTENTDGSYWYWCRIENNIQPETSPTKIKLDIQAGSVYNGPPVLKGSSKNPTFKVGKTGFLECVFSGYKDRNPSNISWYNGFGQITNDEKYTVSNYGRSLEIKNIQESDEQQYTCVARNSVGTANATMTLNVTSKPMWDPEPLQDVVVPEGRDATFYCQTRSAVGEAPPNPPLWILNGDKDIPFGEKYTFTDDKIILTVKNPTKPQDIACFQCYVSNSVGTTFSSACLNVVRKIKIPRPPKAVQSTQKAMEGEGIIDLTVEASADPLTPLTYGWLYKNKNYTNNDAPPFVEYNITTKKATINVTALTKQQQKDIEGVYYRRVYNGVMEVVVNVTVVYEEPPTYVEPVVEAATNLWIIGVVLAVLILLVVIIIVIVVYSQRKGQEGRYYVDKKEKGAGHNLEKEIQDSGFQDLSRLVYDDFPEKKLTPHIDFVGFPVDDSESFGSADYDGEATAFNEDGSFLGEYAEVKDKDKKNPPSKPTASESNV